MRSRHPSSEHQAAVARRLALLGEELAAVRPDSSPAGGDPLERPWWEEHTRVTGARHPVIEPVVDPLAPGRHAARRLPEVGGRLLLGRGQLVVVAVVVALLLAVTGWWLVRGHASGAGQLEAAPAGGLVAAPSVAPVSAEPVGDPSSAASVASASAAGSVTVDVAGKVRHPGVQVLAAGSRVADALRAAGGARPGVDLTSLNLAQVLADGQQVLVGESAPAGGAVAAPTDAPAGPTQLVDLNTATAEQLDTLPDVGPVTAASILSWRDAHGGFTSVDELLEIDGIGEVTLGKIAPYVTI